MKKGGNTRARASRLRRGVSRSARCARAAGGEELVVDSGREGDLEPPADAHDRADLRSTRQSQRS